MVLKMGKDTNNMYVNAIRKKVLERDIMENWNKIFYIRDFLEGSPKRDYKVFLFNTLDNRVAVIDCQCKTQTKKIDIQVMKDCGTKHLGNIIFDREYHDVESAIIDLKEYLKTL